MLVTMGVKENEKLTIFFQKLRTVLECFAGQCNIITTGTIEKHYFSVLLLQENYSLHSQILATTLRGGGRCVDAQHFAAMRVMCLVDCYRVSSDK